MKQYVAGIDTAKSQDYFALIILSIDDEKNVKLAWLNQWKQINYSDMIRKIDIILKKYHTRKVAIDATNESMFAEQLERLSHNVEAIKFTSESKQRMKDNLRTMLESKTLQLPNPKNVKNPDRKRLVATLKEQMENEAKIITPAGNVRYDHTGEHNDLLHALELAAWGARDILQNSGYIAVVSKKFRYEDDFLGSAAPYGARFIDRAVHWPGESI
jgi:hypothetical protein